MPKDENTRVSAVESVPGREHGARGPAHRVGEAPVPGALGPSCGQALLSALAATGAGPRQLPSLPPAPASHLPMGTHSSLRLAGPQVVPTYLGTHRVPGL